MFSFSGMNSLMRSAMICGDTFFATIICWFSTRRSTQLDSDAGSMSSVSK